MLQAQTKTELKNLIKRKLGFPMVKIELCDQQIYDSIDYTISLFLKWAVSNGTDIIYFTIPLEAGKKFYDLQKGILDIIEYTENGVGLHGINTLFTVENYLFNQGAFDILRGGSTGSLVDYHMFLGFMEDLERYRPNQFNWRYHKMTNQLEITPTPEYNNEQLIIKRVDPKTNTLKDYVLDSPGFVMLKANVIQGSTLPNVIRGWEEVVRELKPASELRIINSLEKDENYFVLTNNAINQQLTISKNGNLYENWTWFDDNGKTIKWDNKDEILENDEILCEYNTIEIENNEIDNKAYDETPLTTTDTILITPIEIVAKQFLLSEQTANKPSVKILLNGITYSYGNDFLIDTDNQTILFGGKTLDGILIDGDSVDVVFTTIPTNIEEFKESLYGETFVQDFATAMCKKTLGLIRRKFASFSSIGNQGISLDGDSLISEAIQEMEILKEQLMNEECHEGGYITMG